MCRVKKQALIFASLILLIASICQVASAAEISPRASLYLSNYGAYLYEGTAKGTVRVEFTVSGTRRSERVGVSKLSIYEGDGTFVTSVTGSVANGLLGEDLKTYMGHFTYYGEEDTVYYMVLTMYAERDGGSDSRQYTTNNCRSHV